MSLTWAVILVVGGTDHKEAEWGEFRLSYFKRSRTVNQTGRRHQVAHASLALTASVPEGTGNKYGNNVTRQQSGAISCQSYWAWLQWVGVQRKQSSQTQQRLRVHTLVHSDIDRELRNWTFRMWRSKTIHRSPPPKKRECPSRHCCINSAFFPLVVSAICQLSRSVQGSTSLSTRVTQRQCFMCGVNHIWHGCNKQVVMYVIPPEDACRGGMNQVGRPRSVWCFKASALHGCIKNEGL